VLAGKFGDSLAEVKNEIVAVADDLEFLGQWLTLVKANRVGRSAGAYQTHSVLRSIWPVGTSLLTPEQGQDFQHHARCLREGVDSGLPETAWKCRQKHTRNR
jgi:hypothetical protein